MIMDADDEMEPLKRREIDVMLAETGADALFFETISYVGDSPGLDVLKNMNLRFMKNHMGYFFSGPIHEQIYFPILAANPAARMVNCDLKVYHYGYLTKNIAESNKRARNIALLEKELEARPDYNFAIFNLGSEYYAMKDNVKAIGYFEKAYEKFDPREGYSSHLLLKMVVCYLLLGRMDNAIRMADIGLGHYPEYTDLMFMKGNAYVAAGKNTLALKAFQKCTEMGEAPNHLNVVVGAGTFRPWFIMGNLYFDWEDYEAAANCYRQAFVLNTEHKAALYLLVKAWCRLKPEPSALEEQIETMREFMPPSYDSIVFEQLIQEKYYGLTLSYIDRYERSEGVCAYSRYFRGLARLYKRDYAGAIAMLEGTAGSEKYGLRAFYLGALCRIFIGDYAEAKARLEGTMRGESNDSASRVCLLLLRLLEGGAPETLGDDEAGPAVHTPFIFEVLRILLITRQPEAFEKALGLLNAVSDKTVLLRLAKLYYEEGYFGLAYRELMRSVQVFSHLDEQGAKMLYTLKLRGF